MPVDIKLTQLYVSDYKKNLCIIDNLVDLFLYKLPTRYDENQFGNSNHLDLLGHNS